MCHSKMQARSSLVADICDHITRVMGQSLGRAGAREAVVIESGEKETPAGTWAPSLWHMLAR